MEGMCTFTCPTYYDLSCITQVQEQGCWWRCHFRVDQMVIFVVVLFFFPIYLSVITHCIAQMRWNIIFLSWRDNLVTLLTRIVGKATVEAAGDGSARIGSKALRQRAATLILEKSSTPSESMKRIGGSAKKMRENYVDPTGKVNFYTVCISCVWKCIQAQGQRLHLILCAT